jgi:CheY-specific phosphatase CheX
MPSDADLRVRFQLPPLAPGVKKIASLVAGREKASMEEIAQIIEGDESMSRRVIIMAYPRVAARADATVDMAISRLGINCIIMLLVGDLLTRAVTDTFETMVSIRLETDDPSLMPIEHHGRLTGSVKFNGIANGQVSLAFSNDLGLLSATRLLGGNDDDEFPPDVVSDAVGEIVNIVTGNLQSRLHDAGLESQMEVPEVLVQYGFPKSEVEGASTEQFFFRQATRGLGVNLCINPFSES